MNVKALAAIVGTLSLGALATGCASNKAAEGATATDPAAKGTESSCSGKAEQKGTESSCSGKAGAAPAQEKGSEAKCGAGSCGGKK